MNIQIEVKPEDFLATNPLTNPIELALLRAVPSALKAYADWQIIYVEIDRIIYKMKTPKRVQDFLYSYYADKSSKDQKFKILLALDYEPKYINEETLDLLLES